MIFYYLDASAWVKRYYQESGTIWIQNLFRNYRMACSPLGLVEVLATLTRKHKSRAFGISAFRQKTEDLEDDWRHFIQVELTEEVIKTSKRLIIDFALRGADAIHLASALLLQGRFVDNDDQLILVTSDIEMKNAAKMSSLMVVDPNEQET